MIVRRFDQVTGDEDSPVSIAAAANAIAKSRKSSPSWNEIDDIADDLQSGVRIETSVYVYVPDVVGGTGPVGFSN